MKNKSRNVYLAQFINKIYQLYWFIARPNTRGVKVIIFNTENKILMIRQTYYPNTWTFVGGGVHKNETAEDAAIRECYEEVGITLDDVDFVATLDLNHEYKKDWLSVFKVNIETSHFEIDNKEVAEAGWFELSDLPHMGKNAKEILGTVLNQNI